MTVNAKQRYISTSFWSDPYIQELTPSEKLLFMYLLTNPFTNIAGVYEITIKQMSFDVGFSPEVLREILGRFAKAGKMYFYNNFLIIRNFPKNQKYETRSKIRSGIETILKSLPRDLLNYMVQIGYSYPIDTVYNYSDSDPDSDPDSDLDSTGPAPAPVQVEEVQEEEERDPEAWPVNDVDPTAETKFKDLVPSGPSAFDKITPRYRGADTPQDPPPPDMDPRGEAVHLSAAWYDKYIKKTARPVAPSEDDIKAAWALLQRTDLKTALDSIPVYFESKAWFMYDRDRKTRRYSFAAFCRNFAELEGGPPPSVDYANLQETDF